MKVFSFKIIILFCIVFNFRCFSNVLPPPIHYSFTTKDIYFKANNLSKYKDYKFYYLKASNAVISAIIDEAITNFGIMGTIALITLFIFQKRKNNKETWTQ